MHRGLGLVHLLKTLIEWYLGVCSRDWGWGPGGGRSRGGGGLWGAEGQRLGGGWSRVMRV